jgi:hypothetical protein
LCVGHELPPEYDASTVTWIKAGHQHPLSFTVYSYDGLIYLITDQPGDHAVPRWKSSNNPTNEDARLLGVNRQKLRRVIHRLKQYLGGADAVEIDIDTGDVYGPGDEHLGNLHEEH